MNDDIFERFIKSTGIMFGGYLFLIIMIVTTQKPPREIALKIEIAFEMMAKGLFYIAQRGQLIDHCLDQSKASSRQRNQDQCARLNVNEIRKCNQAQKVVNF